MFQNLRGMSNRIVQKSKVNFKRHLQFLQICGYGSQLTCKIMEPRLLLIRVLSQTEIPKKNNNNKICYSEIWCKS
jgi:hypothetical protein